MQVAIYLAGEITQVKESIPWVRCASGNVSNQNRAAPLLLSFQEQKAAALSEPAVAAPAIAPASEAAPAVAAGAGIVNCSCWMATPSAPSSVFSSSFVD